MESSLFCGLLHEMNFMQHPHVPLLGLLGVSTDKHLKRHGGVVAITQEAYQALLKG